jgi:hypothetical protein
LIRGTVDADRFPGYRDPSLNKSASLAMEEEEEQAKLNAEIIGTGVIAAL